MVKFSVFGIISSLFIELSFASPDGSTSEDFFVSKIDSGLPIQEATKPILQANPLLYKY
jgi:hypothetical protein